ncbi:hypothetical protein I3842_09G133800 [Carya illinoinensis]|uniref:Uncharacterized protein n=1 Tax=Carya illinoinensis TaxID=32201 RepID=A0A922J8T9_CARIL|nr:hypothetical protein I3842_09G133800 [Carya illinoinensis]
MNTATHTMHGTHTKQLNNSHMHDSNSDMQGPRLELYFFRGSGELEWREWNDFFFAFLSFSLSREIALLPGGFLLYFQNGGFYLFFVEERRGYFFGSGNRCWGISLPAGVRPAEVRSFFILGGVARMGVAYFWGTSP